MTAAGSHAQPAAAEPAVVAVAESELQPFATSGKRSVATDENDLPFVATLIDELPQFDIEDEHEITGVAAGWRLERNSNGYYRWRWQMKDAAGNPITYVATSGKPSYRRGSQYVSIREV